MSGTAEDRQGTTEDRLREALAARASLVTHRDLSPGSPPLGRTWGTRRIRRTVTALVGAAAAVVAGCLLLLPGGPFDPAPVPPARSPEVTGPPAPGPADPLPSQVGPSPSVIRPTGP
jgi:hypothetical protein